MRSGTSRRPMREPRSNLIVGTSTIGNSVAMIIGRNVAPLAPARKMRIRSAYAFQTLSTCEEPSSPSHTSVAAAITPMRATRREPADDATGENDNGCSAQRADFGPVRHELLTQCR